MTDDGQNNIKEDEQLGSDAIFQYLINDTKREMTIRIRFYLLVSVIVLVLCSYFIYTSEGFIFFFLSLLLITELGIAVLVVRDILRRRHLELMGTLKTPDEGIKRTHKKCSELFQELSIDWLLDSDGKIEDITHDESNLNQQLILDFLPDIRMVGIDLWLERVFPSPFGTWGGVFARILELKPEKGIQPEKRCIQYVYIYTRQLSSVSIVWWVITPLLIALWFHFMPWMDWWTGLFVFLPLPLMAFWSHYTDPAEKLRPHSTSLLPIFWLLISLKSLNTDIWGMDLSVFSLIVVSIFFSGIWFLDRIGRLPTGHEMDYVPIFVWLKRREGIVDERISEFLEETKDYLASVDYWRSYFRKYGKDTQELLYMSPSKEGLKEQKIAEQNWSWELDSVAWDVYHYTASKKSKQELHDLAKKRNKNEEEYLISGRRVRLLMDNQWHSLRLGGNREGGWVADVLCKLIIILTPFVYLIQWNSLEFPLSSIGFAFYPFLLIEACCYLAAAHISILRISKYSQWNVGVDSYGWDIHTGEITTNRSPWQMPDLAHLEHPILQKFWNLKGAGLDPNKPRLIVVGKMQNPFKFEDSFTSFRDDSNELYIEIKKLQKELQEYGKD